MSEFFKLRKLGRLTPTHQILLLILIYLASAFYYRNENHWYLIFAPLYEEALFRGFLLPSLISLYNKRIALLLSSFLFGIWHLKNLSFMPLNEVLYQMAYAGLIIGPILAWTTLKTKSIWIGVIVHALNNILLSPFSWWVLGMITIQ